MAVDFAKSKTKENLMKAFAGESQARNRYTIAAEEACRKGFYALKEIFLFTADQERAHAARFYELLKTEAGNTIQIEGGYVSGDVETNAGIIKGLDFNPGVTAARDTFKNAFTDLQATGDLNKDLDEKEFEEKAFPVLDGVSETTTYNVETGKFAQE